MNKNILMKNQQTHTHTPTHTHLFFFKKKTNMDKVPICSCHSFSNFVEQKCLQKTSTISHAAMKFGPSFRGVCPNVRVRLTITMACEPLTSTWMISFTNSPWNFCPPKKMFGPKNNCFANDSKFLFQFSLPISLG